MPEPLIAVDHLTKRFPVKKGLFSSGPFSHAQKYVHAVNDLSFTVQKGEVFSLVGESGCGKSSTARTLIRLYEPDEGKILFDGTDISHLDDQGLQPFRRRIQMIFQNPYSSLNPRQTVKEIISEALLFHKIAATKKEAEDKTYYLLQRVGLRPEQADRYPHQFSGGQRQRISIARALAVNPDFIIADEPVSALDVSIQAQILNLLLEIREEFQLSYLFIAHNLAVVKYISDRIGVMYLGTIVEIADEKAIFANPLHPYTKALFASVPVLGEPLQDPAINGDTPSTPIDLPKGCVFYKRCPFAKDICKAEKPQMKEYEKGHFAACHLLAGGGEA